MQLGKVNDASIGFELLPSKFTLTALQVGHETILGETLNKRNLRRKITQSQIVKPTQEWTKTGRKPAQMYEFSVGVVGRSHPAAENTL
jgi:8-oxo-dGTP diphosphatase